ncbi:hypothetical protein LAD77_29855 [Klebsiella pneumoniae]|nr:hypothetical protein [Klebsiella pneumoniae]
MASAGAGGDLSSRVRICARHRVRLETLVSWGVKRILTSGSNPRRRKVFPLINELIAAGDTPIIMPVRESAPRTCRCFCSGGERGP